MLYLNAGASPSTWSIYGTEVGANAPSGYLGNFFDFHVNGGSSIASLSYSGVLTVASCVGCSSSGTVTTGTSGYLAIYPSTGTTVGPEQYVTAAQSAAISGDVSKAAGSANATVTGVNGATIPANSSANCTNGSSQITACSTASILQATSSSIGGSALTAGTCSTTTVTMTGATTSNAVVATPETTPGQGFYELVPYVSAANTVTIGVCATVAGTPTASVWQVRVLP